MATNNNESLKKELIRKSKHNKMKRTLLILTMLFALNLNVLAQKVELHLIPDSPTATYRTGEQARMKVIALDCGVAIYDAEVSYEVSEDLMPARENSTVKQIGRAHV